MKIRNSLKSLKGRHRDNRVIRRRGRTYVINKTNRRFKAPPGLNPRAGACAPVNDDARPAMAGRFIVSPIVLVTAPPPAPAGR